MLYRKFLISIFFVFFFMSAHAQFSAGAPEAEEEAEETVSAANEQLIAYDALPVHVKEYVSGHNIRTPGYIPENGDNFFFTKLGDSYKLYLNRESAGQNIHVATFGKNLRGQTTTAISKQMSNGLFYTSYTEKKQIAAQSGKIAKRYQQDFPKPEATAYNPNEGFMDVIRNPSIQNLQNKSFTFKQLPIDLQELAIKSSNPRYKIAKFDPKESKYEIINIKGKFALKVNYPGDNYRTIELPKSYQKIDKPSISTSPSVRKIKLVINRLPKNDPVPFSSLSRDIQKYVTNHLKQNHAGTVSNKDTVQFTVKDPTGRISKSNPVRLRVNYSTGGERYLTLPPKTQQEFEKNPKAALKKHIAKRIRLNPTSTGFKPTNSVQKTKEGVVSHRVEVFPNAQTIDQKYDISMIPKGDSESGRWETNSHVFMYPSELSREPGMYFEYTPQSPLQPVSYTHPTRYNPVIARVYDSNGRLVESLKVPVSMVDSKLFEAPKTSKASNARDDLIEMSKQKSKKAKKQASNSNQRFVDAINSTTHKELTSSKFQSKTFTFKQLPSDLQSFYLKVAPESFTATPYSENKYQIIDSQNGMLLEVFDPKGKKINRFIQLPKNMQQTTYKSKSKAKTKDSGHRYQRGNGPQSKAAPDKKSSGAKTTKPPKRLVKHAESIGGVVVSTLHPTVTHLADSGFRRPLYSVRPNLSRAKVMNLRSVAPGSYRSSLSRVLKFANKEISGNIW